MYKESLACPSKEIPLTEIYYTMNIEPLKNLIPNEVFLQLPQVIELYNINTPLRMSHFLAQCAHESGNWRFTVENLNYSKEALMSIFRRHFPDQAIAAQYDRKPEQIANRAYANRMGNGDESSGDGWKYRGRGYIQLTGKSNYSVFNQTVQEDVLEFPDLVATKYPLSSAGFFWDTNKLNNIADQGFKEEHVTAVTRRVNGGTHGLSDRLLKFTTYFNTLT